MRRNSAEQTPPHSWGGGGEAAGGAGKAVIVLSGAIVAALAATALAACQDPLGMATVNLAGGAIMFVFVSLGLLWQGFISRALIRSTRGHADAVRQNPSASNRVNALMRLFRNQMRFAEWTWERPWLMGLAAASLAMWIFAVVEIYGAATQATCVGG